MTAILQTVVEYLEIIIVIISFLSLIIGFIAAITKSDKLRLLAERINRIQGWAESFVRDAELFANFRGADKKGWVLTKINQKCIENKIPYDAKLASNIVEKIVTITKNVNKREKDVLSVDGQKELILE